MHEFRRPQALNWHASCVPERRHQHQSASNAIGLLRSRLPASPSLILWFIAKIQKIISSPPQKHFPEKNISHVNAFETFKFFTPHPTGGPSQPHGGPGTRW
jgi:hypothetical protein